MQKVIRMIQPMAPFMMVVQIIARGKALDASRSSSDM